jgi:hypothetical protein
MDLLFLADARRVTLADLIALSEILMGRPATPAEIAEACGGIEYPLIEPLDP